MCAAVCVSACLSRCLSEITLLWWVCLCVGVFYPSVQERMGIVTPHSFHKDRRKNMEAFKEVLKPLKSFLLCKQKSNGGILSLVARGPKQDSDSSHVKLN